MDASHFFLFFFYRLLLKVDTVTPHQADAQDFPKPWRFCALTEIFFALEQPKRGALRFRENEKITRNRCLSTWARLELERVNGAQRSCYVDVTHLSLDKERTIIFRRV